VAVAHGAGLERGEVGAGIGLGIADREVDLAPEERAQGLLLFGLAARRPQTRPDRVQRDERDRRTRTARLLEPDQLLDRRAPLAAVLDRPADPEPTVAPHLADRR